MIAVFKHELKSYFQSMSAYVFGTFLLFFVGIFTMIYNLQVAISNFEYVMESLCLIFIVIVPILTMRVIAEERKQKTDQLLYSLPLTMSEIVLGKYLALLVVFAIPLSIVCIYPIILSLFGNVYLPVLFGTIFAFFVLGSCLISIGLYISSTTESQTVSAGICFVAMVGSYYLSTLTDYISSSAMGSLVALFICCILMAWIIKIMTNNSLFGFIVGLFSMLMIFVLYIFKPELFVGLLPTIVSKISLFDHFSVFVNGTFDLNGIVYYITLLIFFVYLTIQSMEKRRYN